MILDQQQGAVNEGGPLPNGPVAEHASEFFSCHLKTSLQSTYLFKKDKNEDPKDLYL